jgi:hypothetical protein
MTLDELFHHTDIDGDRLRLVTSVEMPGDLLTLSIGDEKGWSSAVYLDHAAALRLSAAFLNHFNPEELTKEERRATP